MLNNKLERLKKILARMESVVVAFSGGVDSSFLLKITRDTLPSENILAITAVSDTYTGEELKQAKKMARLVGVRHRIIHTDELKDKNFIRNFYNRCYFCKKELFGKLKKIAERERFRFVIDASNFDDLSDYRPGREAKREFGVRSPLQEAGITKKDIRFYSKKSGLFTWNQPAMACLASRVPYGQKIKRADLQKIEKAESFIRSMGISLVRVRCHRHIARIEVDKKDIKKFVNQDLCDRIVKKLKSLGFSYVVLDLEGYRTGSLNEVIKLNLVRTPC